MDANAKECDWWVRLMHRWARRIARQLPPGTTGGRSRLRLMGYMRGRVLRLHYHLLIGEPCAGSVALHNWPQSASATDPQRPFCVTLRRCGGTLFPVSRISPDVMRSMFAVPKWAPQKFHINALFDETQFQPQRQPFFQLGTCRNEITRRMPRSHKDSRRGAKSRGARYLTLASTCAGHLIFPRAEFG